jgi:adenosylcobinamide-GDP ribazoletransferase
MKGAITAFKFLARGGRFDLAQVSPQQVSAAVLYLPLVGIFLGLVLVVLNRLLDPHLESEMLGTLLVTVLALLTGANHYEGLQNTFDALATKMGLGERKRRSGAFGVLAIVLVILFKVQALIATGETRSLGLLLTPMFARWSLVIFLYGSDSIAEGSARILAVNMRAWHLVLTTTVVLLVAAFLIARTTLWIGLCLSLFALLSRTYLRWRNGYVSDDNVGAVIELSETLSFVLFASL